MSEGSDEDDRLDAGVYLMGSRLPPDGFVAEPGGGGGSSEGSDVGAGGGGGVMGTSPVVSSITVDMETGEKANAVWEDGLPDGGAFPTVTEASLTVEVSPVMLWCRYCGGIRRGKMNWIRSKVIPREGFPLDCPRCGEEAPHDRLHGVEGHPVKYRVGCPQCPYTTLMWDTPDDSARCPQCELDGPIAELAQISGVGRRKAEALLDAGYETIDDVARAGQGELADVPGIGMALAARIVADLRDPITDVRRRRPTSPKLEVRRVWWEFEEVE